MKTKKILDELNSAIAEAFAPLIGKPARSGDCHEIVAEAIGGILPTNIVKYATWYIIADRSYYGNDAKVFVLSTKGFAPYKGAAGERFNGNTGKWLSAPRYELAEGIDEELLEDCARVALIKVYKTKLEGQETFIKESETNLVRYREHADELRGMIDGTTNRLGEELL